MDIANNKHYNKVQKKAATDFCNGITAKDFEDFYLTHTREETCKNFGIDKYTVQLARMIFDITGFPRKLEQSERELKESSIKIRTKKPIIRAQKHIQTVHVQCI